MRRACSILNAALAAGLLLPALAESAADDPLRQARRLFDEGRLPAAERMLTEAAESGSTRAEAHYYLGRVRLRLYDPDRAVDHLELAVGVDPRDARFQLWLCRAYAEQARTGGLLSRIKWARRWKRQLERAYEIAPADVDIRGDLIAYLANAPAIGGGDKRRATRLAEETMAVDEIAGRLQRALTHRASGDIAAAVLEYREVLRLAPDDPQAHNSLGYHLLKARRYDEAEAHFRSYVRAAPDEANAHDSMGEYHATRGDLSQAIAWYEKALEIDRWSSGTRYKLARTHEQNDDDSQAVRHYEALLSLTPLHERARDAAKRVKALR